MLKPSEECPISNTRAVPRQVFESTSSILKPSVGDTSELDARVSSYKPSSY